MKMLYLDCSMGAAGDMLLGTLVSLLSNEEQEYFIKKINSIGIPNVEVILSDDKKCGISCKHISVLVSGHEEETHDVKKGEDCNHEGHDDCDNHGVQDEHSKHHESHKEEGHHHHSNLNGIYEIIDRLDVSDKVKMDVKSVYTIIAEAESKVHGESVTEVHFHEVGSMDAVTDVTGVAMLMEILSDKYGVEKVISSPINTGFGKVKCAHGILPVPAPATAEIIKGMPTYAGKYEGEMCTPTGAALIKYYSESYGDDPVVIELARGYGSGRKNFEEANVILAILGHGVDAAQ